MKQHTVKLDTYSSVLRLLPLGELASLPQNLLPSQVLWVTDNEVWAALCGPKAPLEFRTAMAPLMHQDDRTQATGSQTNSIPRPSQNVKIIKAGEEHKTWEQVAEILQTGFDIGLARDGFIIGLGGGVVCDMAAFAASLYMRGCQLMLIPSTLLAQVDASLGGKTGINFGGFKNMVGSFYPANEIRIIPELNRTLPDIEFLSGLGEVIKHAFLADPQLLETLKKSRQDILNRKAPILESLVWDSLMVKAKIVEADFKEQSIRAHLNLGHTFAHGLESAAGFGAWSHGEAVAWGMVKAAQLSVRLGLCPPSYAQEVITLIKDYGYRIAAPGVDTSVLINAMLLDKKKKGGRVRFILQTGLCQTIMQTIEEADLRAVLETYP